MSAKLPDIQVHRLLWIQWKN